MTTANKLNNKFAGMDVNDLNNGFGALFGDRIPPPQGGNGSREIVELSLGSVHSFGFYDEERAKMHCFRPYADEKMDEFVESVKKNGILNPLLVRQQDEEYEILAGHNRKEGAIRAGLKTVPCIILDVDDDQAIIIMTRTNIDQREELLPSEKGWAYRLELEAMNRQGERTDLTYSQNGNKLDSQTSSDALAQIMGVSKTTIYRFIRLTYLITSLLEMVDNGTLTLSMGEDLSYLTVPVQYTLLELVESGDITLTPNLVEKLKAELKGRDYSEAEIKLLLKPRHNQPKEASSPLPLSFRLPVTKVHQFFPDKSKDEIEQEIIRVLDEYFKDDANVSVV